MSVSKQQPTTGRIEAGTGAPSAGPAAAVPPQPGCCSPRALRAPPPLPADTAARRRIDRLLPRPGIPAAVYFAALIVLLGLAPHLPRRAELAADGLAFVAAGGWCGLHLWRRPPAPCMVNASGWPGVSPVALAEAGLGRSLIHGDEQLVFLGVLVAALGFEGLWYLAKGTNVISRTTRGTDPRGYLDQ